VTLREAPYYWLECDRCGGRAEYGEFSALADDGEAETLALEDDWTADGTRHRCPACPPLGTKWTSPQGVTHLVPDVGPCATCGQGRHGQP
jgi:hypothetical protein